MAQRLFDTIWASTGTTVQPTDAKLNLGWVNEIPTFEVENYWHKRVDDQHQYLQQTGIGEWLATVSYVNNAIVMASGNLYQSIQAANVGNSPLTFPSAFWKPFGQLEYMPRGSIDGFQVTNNSVDPDGTVDVSIGSCRSLDDSNGRSVGMGLDSVFTKNISGTWTAGAAQPGLASGISLAANTFYTVFALGDVSGQVDVGFDTATATTGAGLLADAAVIAAGFLWARQVGWIYSDALLDIKHFWVDPSTPHSVYWVSSEADAINTNWTTAAHLVPSKAPPLSMMVGQMHLLQSDHPFNENYYFKQSPTSVPDTAPTFDNATGKATFQKTTEGDDAHNYHFEVLVDGLSQYRNRMGGARVNQDEIRFRTLGFRFKR